MLPPQHFMISGKKKGEEILMFSVVLFKFRNDKKDS